MPTPAIALEKLTSSAQAIWTSQGYDGSLPDFWTWGCSGYFWDTMGVPGKNDRKINDDAIGAVSKGRIDIRFGANTDPSVYRTGVATLRPNQVIWYRPGWHRLGTPSGHKAFRQDSPVVVKRDGTENFRKGTTHHTYGVCLGNGFWTDLGFDDRFWTNLHRQTGSGTSSLGCLTLPRSAWDIFYRVVMVELTELSITRFPMILIQGPIN